MQDLYICNVSSNYVSKINLRDYKEEKIYITKEEKMLGSHGIDLNGGNLYVATNNDYNFYEIDLKNFYVSKYYIGMLANDLKIKGQHMYLICCENNCLLVYDMVEKRLNYEISCGNYPHSMDICDYNKLISITNMHNNQLTLVDYEKNDFVKNIRTGNLPMKSKFYKGSEYIYVCESNLGNEENGTFSIYNLNTGYKHKSITLGKSPIDMYFDYDSDTVFVSNHLGNSISIVDLVEFKEITRIEVNGLPRGLCKVGRFLYVVINDICELLKYDMYTKETSFIKIGSDPTEIYIS